MANGSDCHVGVPPEASKYLAGMFLHIPNYHLIDGYLLVMDYVMHIWY